MGELPAATSVCIFSEADHLEQLLRENLGPVIPSVSEGPGGRVACRPHEMSASLAHLHVNRMTRSAARAHELVLYDLLLQTHSHRAARARAGASS